MMAGGNEDSAAPGQHDGPCGDHGGEDSSQESGEDYQLGVALVSILISIAFSVGFGVYSITATWWVALLLAVAVPLVLAGLIKVGGKDGVIPRLGRWLL